MNNLTVAQTFGIGFLVLSVVTTAMWFSAQIIMSM